MTKVLRSVVTGVGGYLPDEIVTNTDLAQVVDTSDEWIVERTGIRQRHRAAKDQPVSDLAVEAARLALEAAGKTPADVDLIIVATTTPDLTFPATATIVQRKLGCPVGVAFDVQAVPTYIAVSSDFDLCAGFSCRTQVPPYDRMIGNVTVEYALTSFADGNGPGARVAAVGLANLRKALP